MIHPAGLTSVTVLTAVFMASQIFYTIVFLVEWYFMRLPIDAVDMDEPLTTPPNRWPHIILLYPVLRELEATMRTTFVALSKVDYPADRYHVIAIPNADDAETIASLKRLEAEFPFLETLEVPPTSDPSWQRVWDAWDANPKAYWWHRGRRAGVKDLPPKKTRQLIYALYRVAAQSNEPNLVIDYIDADSAPPPDHFKAAAIGLRHYDVLQSLNVAGNLNKSLAASWHAFDHMAWDGYKYPHLSSHGKQPYWVLGKGVFYRISDLIELGGFHPWITIEDPEIGLRYWANGKRLGIIPGSLVEEVPETWWAGVTQRKRWVCGFFQTLGRPLRELGLTRWERFKARLLFFPCLSLLGNAIGIPIGIWALWQYASGADILPLWTIWLSIINLVLLVILMVALYARTWQRTRLVTTRWIDRVWYMIRINPLSAIVWWLLWIIPLLIGLRMYLLDEGLVWQRTEKIDANRELVRTQARKNPTR